MSFGRPPSINVGFTPNPPDRGSFPLDHYGECKNQMVQYMKCLKANDSTSTACRELGKTYLDCRMNKGLMERDEWNNLGFANLPNASTSKDKPSSTESKPS